MIKLRDGRLCLTYGYRAAPFGIRARLSEDGVAGTCPSCGGVQARGAIYCWQCGKELTPATVAMPATPSPAPVSATAAGGGMPTVQLPETAPIAAAPEQQPR